MEDYIPVEKDEDRELPVPTAWRLQIAEIVAALVGSSEGTVGNVVCLDRISSDVLRSIDENLAEYGCTIDPVSSLTWGTSIYRWMDGYWQVLVDLFAEGEQVDLVLFLRVAESEGEYRFHVESIHVP
nr:hypothetical protein [uncultured Brevundimonas sp.]